MGDDTEGQSLIHEIKKIGVGIGGIFKDKARTTTVKTRMMGHLQTAGKAVQQLLRVDFENTHPLSIEIENKICDYLKKIIPNCDVILISDMDKGLISDRVIKIIKEMMVKCSIPVVVDPKLGGNYSLYEGFTAITPNRYETELATGGKIADISSLQLAAVKLVEAFHFDHVLITIDKEGMFLFNNDKDFKILSTAPKEINDVSGAGDVVISVIGFLIGARVSLVNAAKIANIAAGLEVAYIGAVPVSKSEIMNELMRLHDPVAVKIKHVDELLELLSEHRKNKDRIVFTNGCFDLLHAGHIEYLKFSRLQGDVLVVGLNSDKSVRQLKGLSRPLVSGNDRARLLSALEDVDYVVIFYETTPGCLIEKVKPDIFVKGEDWCNAGVVGREFVESYGGKVVLAPLVEGLSTTNIVSRIVENHQISRID